MPSAPPEASIRPSGLKARAKTVLVWPVIGCPTGSPVLARHSRIVSSALPDATRSPCGLNATDQAWAV